MLASLLESFSPTTVILALIVIVVSIIYLSTQLKVYRSPGPWGIPVLGYYPFLRSADCHVQLMDLSKKYGEVYLVNVCGKLLVHLSSHKALKEAHVNQADCFTGRSTDFSMMERLVGSGLVMLNDEPWRVLRKFFVQSLRDLGIGMKQHLLKDLLEDSVKDTLDILKKSNGQPINIAELLAEKCTTVSRIVMLGHRVSDETFKELNQSFAKAVDPLIGYANILLGKIPQFFIAPFMKGYKDMQSGKQRMETLLYEILADHKTNFDPDDPKDLIDFFLKERQMLQEKGDPKAKFFTDKSLVITLIQFFGDGGVAIGTVLTTYFMELANDIDVQNAIYDEIVRELGTEKIPTYEDRTKLPFTLAAIKELERRLTFFPVVPSLEANRDTTVLEVFVPKGAVTVTNMYAIHNNPNTYKNPEAFNPKRFLPDKQETDSKEELPITFGVGKRACAGEQFVMTEIFVFFTSFLQHFTFHAVQNKEVEERDKNRASTFSEIFEFQHRAIPRETN